MHVFYITRANGAKQREVFWSLAEAHTFALGLVQEGLKQDESGDGFSKWSPC